MGFTVLNYSHLGLQPQNWYVTIKASYQVRKIESLLRSSGVLPGDNSSETSRSASLNVPSLVTPYYTITFSVYFKASPNSQVINEQYMSFNIQALPNPAVLYLIIYNQVKLTLDPFFGTSQQTLIFTDDILETPQ